MIAPAPPPRARLEADRHHRSPAVAWCVRAASLAVRGRGRRGGAGPRRDRRGRVAPEPLRGPVPQAKLAARPPWRRCRCPLVPTPWPRRPRLPRRRSYPRSPARRRPRSGQSRPRSPSARARRWPSRRQPPRPKPRALWRTGAHVAAAGPERRGKLTAREWRQVRREQRQAHPEARLGAHPAQGLRAGSRAAHPRPQDGRRRRRARPVGHVPPARQGAVAGRAPPGEGGRALLGQGPCAALRRAGRGLRAARQARRGVPRVPRGAGRSARIARRPAGRPRRRPKGAAP
ncbi:MAG: hypothetical protein MZV63_09755 [Marinilabiliales bacterium]|nr:hypothetical protein [Marinilabiliales bacterium]